MTKKLFLILLCLISTHVSKCQINNFSNSDRKKIGFSIGTNLTFIKFEKNKNYFNDTILSVSNSGKLGVVVGLTYNLVKNNKISIESRPSLNVMTSQLNYKTYHNNEEQIINIFTDFVGIEISTLFKYYSLRFYNLNTNLLVGISPIFFIKGKGQYYIDIENGYVSPYLMNFKTFDFFADFGFGIDYLGVTNLHSIELIFSTGFSNIFILDKSEFTKILNSIFIRSITFRYIFN
jgi:hypothetical protein